MPSADPPTGRMTIVPLPFRTASDYVNQIHRSHRAPQGHKFSLGAVAASGLVGVAIVGRPVARALDDGLTVEVTRLATPGHPNACSFLYGAVWRAARALGYQRAITYTQQGESGASLRAAGWRNAADCRARPGWDTPSRPRTSHGTEQIPRTRWEITLPTR